MPDGKSGIKKSTRVLVKLQNLEFTSDAPKEEKVRLMKNQLNHRVI